MDAVMTPTRSEPNGFAVANARERLDQFLHAHRVSATQRARLVPELLAAAERRHTADPTVSLGASAIDEAIRHIDQWIARLVSQNERETPARRAAHALAAVHLADVPRRWPEAFLAPDEPPAELVEALRAAYLEAAPDVALSSMVPRPITLGVVSDVADRTWRTFDKWPVLRGLVMWTLFGALLLAAFWLVRF
jgi:hypothetical protein